MNFCPAGILCIAISLWIVVRKKDCFFYLVLFVTILQIFIGKGFLLQIGGTNIPLITLPWFMIVAYCLLNVRSISNKFKVQYLVFACCLCIPIVSLFMFPSKVWVAQSPFVTWDEILFEGAAPVHPMVTREVFVTTIKFVTYPLVLYYIYTRWQCKDYVRLLGKLSYVSNVFLAMGVIEFVVKNIFRMNTQWGDFDLFFWGDVESTVHAGRLRGIFYESCLFTREASHYAFTLFMVALIKFANNVCRNNDRKIDKSMISCFVLMFLSTAFSAVLMFSTFMAIYFVYKYGFERSSLLVYILIILFIIIIAVPFITAADISIVNRINDLFDSFADYMSFDLNKSYQYSSDGSTQIRLISAFQTFRAFCERPLFGYSLGTLTSHSPTATFLGNVGIVGLILWMRLYFLNNPLKKMVNTLPGLYAIGIGIYLFFNFWGGGIMLSAFGIFTPMIYAICLCLIFKKEV